MQCGNSRPTASTYLTYLGFLSLATFSASSLFFRRFAFCLSFFFLFLIFRFFLSWAESSGAIRPPESYWGLRRADMFSMWKN